MKGRGEWRCVVSGGFPHLFFVRVQGHSISQSAHPGPYYGSCVSSHSGAMDHGEGRVLGSSSDYRNAVFLSLPCVTGG